MADIFIRRRTLPPYNDGSDLSPRDQALARIEALLQEELLPPPVDEEAGPMIEPDPVNPEEVVEIAKLSLPAKPSTPIAASRSVPSGPVSTPLPSPSKTSPVHALLQALILLFVLCWVFILGIVVGRGHLWESGPVNEAVTWLEEKIGWNRADEPAIIFVQEPAAALDDEIDWEDVRRQYGYSDSHSEGDGEAPESSSIQPSYQEPGMAADSLSVDAEPSSRDVSDESADDLTNSQWLADASSLANYDGPSVGYLERGDSRPVEEFEADAGEEEPDLSTPDDDEPMSATPAPFVSVPSRADEPEAKAESMIADATEGKYAVQVASAYDEIEAQKRVEKLQSQGFPAYYYKTSGGRYPVRVGRFVTHAEANEAKIRLESLGYKGNYISTLTD